MGLFYRIVIAIIRVLFWVLFHIEFEGLQNIPESGGIIAVSNHRSQVDPFFLAFGSRRQIFFMGKQELFKLGILRFIFGRLGAFAVDRGKGDTHALDHAKALVRENKIIGIFIEGTRSVSGELLRPKSGAALVARETGAMILPCAILYEGGLRLRRRIIVRFGEIMSNEDLGFVDGLPSSLKRASNVMMGRIRSLLEGEAVAD